MDEFAEINTADWRSRYVRTRIAIDIPSQIRALRKQRGWTQAELAERTGMKQSRIALIERPGISRFKLETLERIAKAFDIGLQVRFVSFSEIQRQINELDLENFSALSYAEEVALGEGGDAT